MGFLQSVLFVECLCYNNDIIILPDNMKAGGMLYEMMALSDRGGGGRRQYGGGRRGGRYGEPGRAARSGGVADAAAVADGHRQSLHFC